MTNTIEVDFATVLPAGARLPSYAIASVIELSEDGTLLPQSWALKKAVRLEPGAVSTLLKLWVGRFLVQLQAPSGHLLTYEAVVEDDEQALRIAPSRREHSFLRDGPLLLDAFQRFEVRESSRHYITGIEQLRWPSQYEPLRLSREDKENPYVHTFKVFPAANLDTLASRASLGFLDAVSRRQDFMGLAKLHARPNFESYRGGVRSEDLLPALLDGIDMIQRVPLHGEKNHLHCAWSFSKRRDSSRVEDSFDHIGSRQFAVSYRVKDDFKLLQLACIPGSWVSQDDVPVGISATMRPVMPHQQATLRIDVEDPSFRGLKDFLQAGNLSAVLELIGDYEQVFGSDYGNPYATAAALYGLIHTDRADEVQRNLLVTWVLRLNEKFSELPDFAILVTTLLLQHPTHMWSGVPPSAHPVGSSSSLEEAAEWALRAVRQGPPLYRMGLELLQDNLDILESELTEHDALASELKLASQYVRALQLRVDPTQAFCVFDISR